MAYQVFCKHLYRVVRKAKNLNFGERPESQGRRGRGPQGYQNDPSESARGQTIFKVSCQKITTQLKKSAVLWIENLKKNSENS